MMSLKSDQNSKSSGLEIDSRIKLLMVVLMTTTTFMAPNLFLLIWNYGIIIFLWLLIGMGKSAIKMTLFLLFIIIFEYIILIVDNEIIQANIRIVLFIAERALIFFIMGAWMIAKLHVGDFLVGMQRLHLPKGIIISLAVMFRYLPTVKEEFRYIKNTMKLRGITFNLKNILFRPIKTIEYALVPLIIRTLTIADQLAASAMTRGLDLQTERTSYRIVRLKWNDFVMIITLFFVVAAGFYLDLIIQNGIIL
jgi:energy-coupling factor transport system permease protein